MAERFPLHDQAAKLGSLEGYGECRPPSVSERFVRVGELAATTRPDAGLAGLVEDSRDLQEARTGAILTVYVR